MFIQLLLVALVTSLGMDVGKCGATTPLAGAISHTTHDQMSDGAFNLPKVVVCINIGAI